MNTKFFSYIIIFFSLADKLSEVRNFTCSAKGYYYITCSWLPPFSLDEVPIYGYIINVTNEGYNTQNTTYTNTTSLIFQPSQFGNYKISVAGNNSAGEGNVAYQAVTLSNSKLHYSAFIKNSVSIVTISEYSVTAEKVNGNWTTVFTIKVMLYISI